jgi:hypothetical protein
MSIVRCLRSQVRGGGRDALEDHLRDTSLVQTPKLRSQSVRYQKDVIALRHRPYLRPLALATLALGHLARVHRREF